MSKSIKKVDWAKLINGRLPMEMQKEIERLKNELSQSEKNYRSAVKGRKEFRKAFKKSKQQSDARLEALNRITSASDDLITWTMAHRPKNSPEHDNLYKELERSIKSSKKTINGESSPTSQRVEDLKEDANSPERWYLRSSGHKDYFRIQEEISDNEIIYLDSFVESQFESVQIHLQDIVHAHNKGIKALSGEESRNQKLEDGISSSLETLRFIKSETDKEHIVMLHEINSRIGQLEAIKSLDND